MYIQKVKLQNFRSFGDAPFTLQHIRSAFSHKNL